LYFVASRASVPFDLSFASPDLIWVPTASPFVVRDHSAAFRVTVLDRSANERLVAALAAFLAGQ
jgi:hypothetical protein